MMGCFNATCNISGNTIHSDDKVRLVIMRPPISDWRKARGSCYTNDIVSPFTLPIKGKYDDYGTIEDVVEDTNTKLIASFFDKRNQSGTIEFEDKEESENKENKSIEEWIKALRDFEFVEHSEKLELSHSLVLEEVWQGYLKIDNKIEEFKKSADDWLLWYQELKQTLSKLPTEEKRRWEYMLLNNYGETARFETFDKIKLPKLKSDSKYGDNYFLSAINHDTCFYKYWFKAVYGSILSGTDEIGEPLPNEIVSIEDQRWVDLRDSLAEYVHIVDLMDSVGKRWLPLVTCGQTYDWEQQLEMLKVSQNLLKKRIRKYKREYGE